MFIDLCRNMTLKFEYDNDFYYLVEVFLMFISIDLNVYSLVRDIDLGIDTKINLGKRTKKRAIDSRSTDNLCDYIDWINTSYITNFVLWIDPKSRKTHFKFMFDMVKDVGIERMSITVQHWYFHHFINEVIVDQIMDLLLDSKVLNNDVLKYIIKPMLNCNSIDTFYNL